MQIISQEKEKILPWRLMALRESELNGYCPKRKSPCLRLGRKQRFERGESETDLLVHAHWTNSHFSLVSFLFFFVFFLIFFLFLLPLFFFSLRKILCFLVPFLGYGKGPFIVPTVTNVLPFCPLTASLWSGRTCRPPGLCDIHPCQTKASLFCFSVYHNISSCHGINAFSLYSQSMYPMVPPQTCLFWVVYHPSRMYLPKGLGQEPRNRPFPLSPPPNHTAFTSYLWPMAPPCPILAEYRLVVPGPCGCFPFRFVQESTCCSCFCRDLETLHLCFLTLHVGFSLIPHSIQELGFVWW